MFAGGHLSALQYLRNGSFLAVHGTHDGISLRFLQSTFEVTLCQTDLIYYCTVFSDMLLLSAHGRHYGLLQSKSRYVLPISLLAMLPYLSKTVSLPKGSFWCMI
ncbi:hypothetical protein I3760_04G039700 [Carya illinoinensis]|nr:hypothetical protein I3760_04G039700 [Carya illinoinensis]